MLKFMRIIFAQLLRLYQNVTKQNYFITEYHIKRKNGRISCLNFRQNWPDIVLNNKDQYF